MEKYLVYDAETENHHKYKRFASPFIPENWVIMRGYKLMGAKQCYRTHHPKPDGKSIVIPKDVKVLVGHHIKFDLLYEWNSPELKAFFKRGGKVWDTMLAEYFLGGMRMEVQMVSLDDICEKYGGRKKIDGVKALWNAGYLTSQIDPDMLTDYLIGTEAEDRNSGDVGNTEKIFLGQYKRAEAAGMLPMLWARMDSYLATCEMEYNGLKIDVQEAKRRATELEHELEAAEAELTKYIPKLPPELKFNWGSHWHRSALVFGGAIKYEKQAPYKDENGELVRYKAFEQWPMYKGEAVDPRTFDMEIGLDKYPVVTHSCTPCENCSGTGCLNVPQDTYVSGVKKGQPKFKKVEVQGEIRTKKQTFFVRLKGYTKPDPKWQMALKDCTGAFIYSTASDIVEEMAGRGVPFLDALVKRQNITKDLGTYYIRYDESSGEYVGMMTCVMPKTHLIHHTLKHVNTVTGRLSSSDPNLQNIPRGDTSEVKKMFVSRFLNGVMMESDYSQLEVVVQGLLSKDKNLCQDLRNKVDFHCKRVAARQGVSYDVALHRCKNAEYPEHKLWKKYRTECKEFSFQRAYGAGAAKISMTTGMTVEAVKALIEQEDLMYPGVLMFNSEVEQTVKRSAKPFKDFTNGGKVYKRGYWKAPTGTLYSFRSYDAQDWQRERGITDSFSPTEMKNYPVQGTGGEIVQIVLGKLWRHFVAKDNYGGNALLCNTVHDCVWFDVVKDYTEEVAKETKAIMESVPELLRSMYGMKVDVPFPVEVEVGENLFNKTVLHV